MSGSGLATRCPRVFALLCLTALAAAWPAAAGAQTPLGSDVPRRGSVEITGGVVGFGALDMGSLNAEETRNINTGTGPFALFAADSRVAAAPGAQLRVGVYLSRAISVEAGLQYGRPTLSSRLSADAEEAPGLTADERLTRYLVDGSLLLHLTGLSFGGGRGVPFLAGGAGYLRELHEHNEFIETGHELHANAGLKWWFGTGPHRFGVRADVGVSFRDGGVSLESSRRTVPTAGVSLAYLF
jgi:hypothetical protein